MVKTLVDSDFTLDSYSNYRYILDFTEEAIEVKTTIENPNIYIRGYVDGEVSPSLIIPVKFSPNAPQPPTLHIRSFTDDQYQLSADYDYASLSAGESGKISAGFNTAINKKWYFVKDSSEVPEDDNAFATVDDLAKFWRALQPDEIERAKYLLELASDTLRQVALNANKNLEKMVEDGKVLSNTLKQIVMEAVKRAMLTPVDQKPITQGSMTAGPYAESFTFANPAGDIWFKDKELKILKLTGQKFSSISTSRTNIYEVEGE